jgi:zinc transport system substrate-binding protein
VSRQPGKRLLASHPVYQYLARRYSLNLNSVMWEPDVLPAEHEWQTLAELCEGHPAAWTLWEGEPLDETSRRLHRIGVQSAVFDPCANRPVSGDFLSVMSDNLENLARVFEQAVDKQDR